MLRGWVVFSNLWFSIGRRTLSVAASRLPFLGLHRALGGTCRVTVLSVAYLGQLLGCLLAAKELLSQDSYPILFRIVPRRCLGGRGHLMHRTILVHIPLLQKYSLCDGIEAVYLSCFHSLLLLFMLRPLSDLCRACVCVWACCRVSISAMVLFCSHLFVGAGHFFLAEAPRPKTLVHNASQYAPPSVKARRPYTGITRRPALCAPGHFPRFPTSGPLTW